VAGSARQCPGGLAYGRGQQRRRQLLVVGHRVLAGEPSQADLRASDANRARDGIGGAGTTRQPATPSGMGSRVAGRSQAMESGRPSPRRTQCPGFAPGTAAQAHARLPTLAHARCGHLPQKRRAVGQAQVFSRRPHQGPQAPATDDGHPASSSHTMTNAIVIYKLS
jgi:hypothetical protein